MTQFNYSSINSLTHFIVFAVFFYTLWKIPSKPHSTRLLLWYCFFSMGYMATSFVYSSWNTDWQIWFGSTQYVWLLASQWCMIQVAYHFPTQFRPQSRSQFRSQARPPEHRIVAWVSAVLCCMGAASAILYIVLRIGLHQNLPPLLSFASVVLVVCSLWTISVFVRQARSFDAQNEHESDHSSGHASELGGTVTNRRQQFAAYSFALLTAVLFLMFVLTVLRDMMIVSYIWANLVANIGTTLYIAGLFMVYSNVASEAISTASKLKFALVVSVLLAINPSSFFLLLDRQREYEAQELQRIQEIDTLLDVPVDATVDTALVEKYCRRAGVQCLFSQPAPHKYAHPEEHLKTPHPHSSTVILYASQPKFAQRYRHNVKVTTLMKAVGTNAARTHEYASVFVVPNFFANNRIDGRVYVWQNGTAMPHTMYNIVMPFEPLAKYVERPAVLILGMLIVITIFTVVSVDAFLRLTFVKPFEQLLSGMDDVNRGNLDVRVAVYTHDELGRLTMNFNRMIASIKTAQEKYFSLVNRQNIILQQEVAFATEEIRTINEQLTQSNEDLRSLNHEKTEFLGIVAHDLKNPLVGVRMAAETVHQELLRHEPLRHEAAEKLMKIIAATTAMIDSVGMLLDVNKSETGKPTFTIAPVNLVVVARAVMDDFYEQARQKSIALTLEAVEPIVWARADEKSVYRIVDNVLSNAIKFSPSGTTVRVAVLCFDNSVVVKVKDEGPGLSASDKTRIFGTFERLSAQPTAGESSSGLGLAIVKKLVEAMNGSVYAETNAESPEETLAGERTGTAGTTIVITLPRATESVTVPD